MKAVSFLLARALDLIDALFDAISSILRVLVRGAFTADATAYSGSRFAALASADVLSQVIDLNAGDRGQALRAIALDPERHLPLGVDAVKFDVAGPLDSDAVRVRPERSFILSVVRKDALARVRADLPAGRRTAIEGFTHAPPTYPDQRLAFVDAAGRGRRRLRRFALAVALAAFGWTSVEAYGAWIDALDRALVQVEDQRLQATRRVRLAERRAHDMDAALAALAGPAAPALPDVAAELSMLAYRQPPHTEIVALEFAGGVLTLRGHSFDPSDTELEFRRSFEAAEIVFLAAPAETPPQTTDGAATFEARIGRSSARPPS